MLVVSFLQTSASRLLHELRRVAAFLRPYIVFVMSASIMQMLRYITALLLTVVMLFPHGACCVSPFDAAEKETVASPPKSCCAARVTIPTQDEHSDDSFPSKSTCCCGERALPQEPQRIAPESMPHFISFIPAPFVMADAGAAALRAESPPRSSTRRPHKLLCRWNC